MSNFVRQIRNPLELFAMSFENSKIAYEALTYEDVLLAPGYSEILPRETDTTTRLTRNITLNIPLISSAMDTVTETDLAIAMALEGGMGFIHKNMPKEMQAEQVRKVKRSQSGLIIDPITLPFDATIGDANRIMREFKIGGIPVIDDNNTLIGIITNRDLRFQKNMSRPIKEVMTTENLITASVGISLLQAEDILQEYKIEKLPIVDKNGKLTGLITYKDILKRKDKPNACKDEYGRLRVGAAVGVTPDILERIEALKTAGVDVISIDTAHGHTKGVVDVLKKVKDKFKNIDIVVGNIATAAATAATTGFLSSLGINFAMGSLIFS